MSRTTDPELDALLRIESHWDFEPCPMCGDEANIHLKGGGACPHCGELLGPFWVMCEHCGLSTDTFPTPESAIEKWNTRAKPKEDE